ncbi:glycosyltransferase [Pedobacter cryoconitis]|uniref:Glycosyltransferase involved in cell wall biosynthesis n=1 Tax=Pedobacter cryoconitis TaxID=188932 RepID=A0A7X0J4F1_9SPHI|nr:glycosyltransferase [Pedobacter cryoconitis]MBB6500860.1 glycosyltransferase involved in cell wall biosynthesis [Pedobacter cryoconitis]
MRKILIVTPYMPFPLNSGGRIAQFEFNDELRHHFKMTIAFTMKPHEQEHYEELKTLWSNVNFKPYLIREKSLSDKFHTILFRFSEFFNRLVGKGVFSVFCKTNLDQLLKLNTTLFRSKSFGFPKGFIDHFRDVLLEDNFEYVQVEFHQLISFAKYIPRSSHRIFVHHEIRFVREKRELELFSFSSGFLKRIYRKNKAFELSALRKYDTVCTLSETDRLILEKDIKKTHLVSSPVPMKAGKKDGSFSFENKLVFLGGEDHFPNKEGLDWFLMNCWKPLKAGYPQLRVEIVGKWNQQTVNNYQEQLDGVSFLGYVDNLNEVLENSIFIVPIRIGSGIRMKIIEAVNLGVPFVSTEVGAEGLCFESGRDCLIGNSPQEFCWAITKIIEDENLGLRLLTNAQRTLKEENSYEKLMQQRLSIYKKRTVDENNYR